ncbi:Na+/H+ antiporter subunit E [Kocuria rhizophila]|uniref:Na+/H+ antiporter subunit E n=1 Tax=Kocuria TaxID=57493 RepID=UPI00214F863D|nr:Na+/H+ antiporter subunit E [Kocuria rhizophila]MCR4526374.1 Na+/H+ antiporter subunit E [Kocuria rhizophila]WIW68179.1 Na+/H+ antiporter subunit E [Kocuria sp. ChxB]
MSWLTWPLRLVWFALWFIGRLALTNIAVVKDVAVSQQKSSPVVVAYVTQCDSDLEVAVLSMMISLTPGTLVLATRDAPHAPGDDPDHGHAGSRIYVHVMYADGVGQALSELREDETHLLHAFRRKGVPE